MNLINRTFKVFNKKHDAQKHDQQNFAYYALKTNVRFRMRNHRNQKMTALIFIDSNPPIIWNLPTGEHYKTYLKITAKSKLNY